MSDELRDADGYEIVEQPQWWGCRGVRGGWGGWESCDGSLPQRGAAIIVFGQSGLDQCRVYGTTKDRNAKRSALVEAAMKAGRP